MIDEPLPTPDDTGAEPKLTDRDAPGRNVPDRDAPGRNVPDRDALDRDALDRDAPDPSRESATSDRGPREEPDRATDPPPDRPDGDAACECNRGPDGEADEADDSDAREYRLERLRLWRTVVTLAVVVARLLRSL